MSAYHSSVWKIILINPLTAQACKIPRLKVHGQPCKQSISWLYITSTFDATRFDENPFSCRCKKENKMAKGF